MRTHGKSKTRTYKTWLKMRERCTNPSCAQWKWYGGRGITVCDRWLNSFEAFYADMGERPEGKTIDRIEDHLGYELANCRWATHDEQIRNQAKTIKVSLNGETVALTEACERLGVSSTMVYQRMKKRGMAFEAACGRDHLREVKTEARLREYVDLRKSGKTHAELSRHFNLSIGALEKWSSDARARGWLRSNIYQGERP